MASDPKFFQESLIRLRNDSGMEPFVMWLKQEYENAVNALVGASDDHVIHVAQGDARRLKMILDLISGDRVTRR